jgi:hypothetical protein
MSGVIDVNSTWMKIHDRELLLFVPRSRTDQSDSRHRLQFPFRDRPQSVKNTS